MGGWRREQEAAKPLVSRTYQEKPRLSGRGSSCNITYILAKGRETGIASKTFLDYTHIEVRPSRKFIFIESFLVPIEHQTGTLFFGNINYFFRLVKWLNLADDAAVHDGQRHDIKASMGKGAKRLIPLFLESNVVPETKRGVIQKASFCLS